jgi:60 kDa SS-A/Ro ribonucleoprotein
MARTNLRNNVPVETTHEGAPAKRINYEAQLRRTLCSCLLWEDGFYESGEGIAERIAGLIKHVNPKIVAQLAIDARSQYKLRHVPLLIAREMARLGPEYKKMVGSTLPRIIKRADELAEFLAIYWKESRQPLSNQVKRGLAEAFGSFNEYALAKYNRDNAIKLRDVMFLCHPKPKNEEQEMLWKKLVDGTLATPDTWEVNLSAGKDKKETFTRLITEDKLGALAMLRNLRNMQESGVTDTVIRKGLNGMHVELVLPFRFIAAANYATRFEPELEKAMFRSVVGLPKLGGKTVILVDNSGSMSYNLSSRAEMKYIDAACAIAMIAREMGEEVQTYVFSDSCCHIPSRRGFALRDAIKQSVRPSGTNLGGAIRMVDVQEREYDRLIVITDEQSADQVKSPVGKAYAINVASNRNGVTYGGNWTHVDGFSESVLRYIYELEQLNK